MADKPIQKPFDRLPLFNLAGFVYPAPKTFMQVTGTVTPLSPATGEEGVGRWSYIALFWMGSAAPTSLPSAAYTQTATATILYATDSDTPDQSPNTWETPSYETNFSPPTDLSVFPLNNITASSFNFAQFGQLRGASSSETFPIAVSGLASAHSPLIRRNWRNIVTGFIDQNQESVTTKPQAAVYNFSGTLTSTGGTALPPDRNSYYAVNATQEWLTIIFREHFPSTGAAANLSQSIYDTQSGGIEFVAALGSGCSGPLFNTGEPVCWEAT